jgi:hypothetical protein
MPELNDQGIFVFNNGRLQFHFLLATLIVTQLGSVGLVQSPI